MGEVEMVMGNETKTTTARTVCNWIATLAIVSALLVGTPAADAQLLGGLLGTTQPPSRLIVRDSLGLLGIVNTCLLLGCTVQQTLDGTVGQLFLVTAPSTLNLLNLVTGLVKDRKSVV